MGKTLTNIALIGAAIAVNVVPGVGQAISGAIVGLGGGTFAALGVAQTVVGALQVGLTIAGIQAATGIIMGSPSLPKPDTTSTALKTSRPPRVSGYGISRLYGAYILFETATDGTAVDVYAIHDGQLTEIVRWYLADDAVTLAGNIVQAGVDGRYGSGKLRLYWTTGLTPGSPFSAVTAKLPGIWTANHRGDGVVLAALLSTPVKSEDFLDIYPNGVPVASMVAKWQKCPDLWAADPTDESQWTWTENCIRHLAHYLLVREGADYATKIAPTLAYWRAAQDVCDEDIALKAGGTEKRWRSCLSHTHTQKHGDIKAAMLATCDGWMAPRADGALVVYAGKYYAPTVSIGSDEIVAYEWNGVGVDDDEAVNYITCSYVSADHDYNTVECDPWTDEDDISRRGQELTESLDPQVPSWGQVRRLAKRRMQRANALYRGTVTTNVAGRKVRGQRYINLHIEEAGSVFYSGPAEITAITRNMQTGGVTFSWVAASPNIDAWNPATEEGSPAASGDRVAPQPLTAPAITSATPELSADGVTAQIRMIVSGPDREDLTWFLRWKLSSETIWNEAQNGDVDPGASVELLSTLVPTNSSIDVAVSYQVGDGRVSPWSATETVSTSTATLAPLPPTDFSAIGGAGEANLSWRNPSATFAFIRVYRGPTADFGDASLISGDIVGGLGEVMSLDDTGLSASTYYYFLRSFNASAIPSSVVGPQSAVVT
ncbi:hypothetical protein GCM10007897_41410 [Sphingobium jiangsuense]|uniref:Tip attachment protein J domain-containing protein n=1 Tax=Sphingobium jiangsuense TaxID=870476 RepID=A0A7W6BMU3_9SPHN|nr:hypothetical protein [Sphingobium jiangsuense]MBB3927816.1 hypothetical protein [Sphingobium jiangsuense]GLT02719.1 hypothetical protein GCM10007897_41410 [Sphingobium jiangsuense]